MLRNVANVSPSRNGRVVIVGRGQGAWACYAAPSEYPMRLTRFSRAQTPVRPTLWIGSGSAAKRHSRLAVPRGRAARRARLATTTARVGRRTADARRPNGAACYSATRPNWSGSMRSGPARRGTPLQWPGCGSARRAPSAGPTSPTRRTATGSSSPSAAARGRDEGTRRRRTRSCAFAADGGAGGRGRRWRASVTAHAGRVRLASELTSRVRVDHRRDARRELEDKPDGGALLGRADRSRSADDLTKTPRRGRAVPGWSSRRPPGRNSRVRPRPSWSWWIARRRRRARRLALVRR